MTDHPLATFLCGPHDITPGGCKDTQPCLCLRIQASIAVDTAARALLAIPLITLPHRCAELDMAVAGLRAAVERGDRLGLLQEMSV